ncbi:MAG: purine nucleoside permease, partial [Pseudomonadota bacterium]
MLPYVEAKLRMPVFVTGLLIALVGCATQDSSQSTPIKPKVVIITMFERGADSGDAPGEFQFWNVRRELSTVFPFGAHHDLHYNPNSGLLGVVTGIGTAKAAASIMALGMDPRFDLTQSYFLVAGISGF